jgi:hypothetical protein
MSVAKVGKGKLNAEGRFLCRMGERNTKPELSANFSPYHPQCSNRENEN